MQYFDTGKYGVIFTVVLVFFILLNVRRARSAKGLYLRRIAGLNAIDEAIGRATEMGKPVLMVPGIGDIDQIGVQAQALTIFSYISQTIARFGSPMRLCVAHPATFTLAQEIIRAAYQSEGMAERYDPDSVQFVTDRQFAFAAGVAGMIHRDKTAACFFLGSFYAESLIFAETANSVGAIQVAGSTQNTQTPFFIAACDYVLIGDEFYAASAYLSREPVLVGSLVGQDWCKLLVAATVLIFTISTTVQSMQSISEIRTSDGRWISKDADGNPVKEHKRAMDETFMHAVFNPANPVRGEPLDWRALTLAEGMLLRKAELNAGDAIEQNEETIEELKGRWYRWEITEGETKRYVDDFFAQTPDGKVILLRTYRSRPQRPPEPAPAAAGSGGEG